MCSLRSRYRLAGGVALLALAGCHAYAPTYPAYGTPACPPSFSPGPTLGPSLGAPTTLPPGGGTIIQDPGTLSPGGGPTLTPTAPGGQPYPTPVQPNGSTGGDSWPTPNGPPPFQGGSQPGQKLVPNYGDPNELAPFESTRNTSPATRSGNSRSGSAPVGTSSGGIPAGAQPFQNDSPFKEDFHKDGGAAQLNGGAHAGGPVFAEAQTPAEMPPRVQPTSATQTTALPAAPALSPAAVPAAVPPAVPAVPAAPAPSTVPAVPAATSPPTVPAAPAATTVPPAATTLATPPNPFDHDHQSFRWLRGVIDQNLQDHTWHIRFGHDPDATVQLNAPPQTFAKIRPGDVVYVEGVPEPDGYRYHVDRLFGPLVPKPRDPAAPSLSAR